MPESYITPIRGHNTNFPFAWEVRGNWGNGFGVPDQLWMLMDTLPPPVPKRGLTMLLKMEPKV